MPTKSNLFVDTSGWVVLLYPQDPLHRLASDIATHAVDAENRRLVTTSYVLTEVVPLLGRFRFSRQSVVNAVNSIKANPNVDIIHVELATDAEAWHLLETRLDKEWSLVDATRFVIMRRYGMSEALTTDHHFDQAGFTRLLSL